MIQPKVTGVMSRYKSKGGGMLTLWAAKTTDSSRLWTYSDIEGVRYLAPEILSDYDLVFYDRIVGPFDQDER